MRVFYQNCVTAAIATLLLPIASTAQDSSVNGAPFSGLVVFSGSLSDTGNAASVDGDFPAPYYKNRTTNGLNAIDVLADKFHLSSDPSLHLVGKQGGTNYAVLHASAHGNLPIDLPAQVDAYLVSRNFAADPKALYFIFVGANDIVSATIERDDAKAEEILRNGIAATEAAFRKVYSAGGRMFYAPNNVNLGIAPVTKQFGVSERATAFSVKFNSMWEQKMRQLERELDVPIFRFDFFRQIEDFLKVAGTIGFTDVTRPCLAVMAQGGCDLERFAFFTELLPTRRIHQLLGDGLAEALMQQLASEECMVGHRCGRKKGSQSYATVNLREDFE